MSINLALNRGMRARALMDGNVIDLNVVYVCIACTGVSTATLRDFRRKNCDRSPRNSLKNHFDRMLFALKQLASAELLKVFSVEHSLCTLCYV